jgi:hypothetical protein
MACTMHSGVPYPAAGCAGLRWVRAMCKKCVSTVRALQTISSSTEQGAHGKQLWTTQSRRLHPGMPAMTWQLLVGVSRQQQEAGSLPATAVTFDWFESTRPVVMLTAVITASVTAGLWWQQALIEPILPLL